MNRSLLLFTLTTLAAGAYACSSDETPSNGSTTTTTSDAGGTPSDGGGAKDSGGTTNDGGGGSDSSTPTDSGVDAAPAIPCTEAELDAVGANFTGVDAGGQGAGGADISFPGNGVAAAQYTNRCVKIKVGQKVTFAGGFSSHPLEAFAGTTPSPIPAKFSQADAGTLEVTFPTAGTYGFRCNFHPLVMNGAVKVVP